jgi:Zn-dependent protease with chaperone function
MLDYKQGFYLMGATVWRGMIYIDPALSQKLTNRERTVLVFHELAHEKGHDRIQILLFMLAQTGLTFASFVTGYWFIGVALMLFFVPMTNAFRRRLELMADEYALNRTKDYDGFISLMDKLEHNGNTHPGKAERISLAEKMRTEHERR